ncbi:MAG TPA: HAMP domain-containing sensor histidine kinase [Spirochaetales bacterium]|nr:HAMP domain-containing sensor histidine kinase [Spirochaetales bacterium]
MTVTIDPDATETDFLPAPRYHQADLDRQRSVLESVPFVAAARYLPILIFVLNDRRQIVWLNDQALALVGQATGARPGEALGCIHSCEKPGGCGTTSFCAYCAAPSAIMKALEGAEDREECAIQLDPGHSPDALDLLLWSRPLDAGDQRYVVFVARDISKEKRREALERIFYHDIGNTVTGMRSMLELVEAARDASGTDYLDYFKSATDQLIEEIEGQRALRDAESGTLESVREPVDLRAVLTQAVTLYRYASMSRDVGVTLDPDGPSPLVMGDPVLVRRVAVNMLKNAFEASARGQTVRAGCFQTGEDAGLWVWNDAVMDSETRRRVFQRSFSTKGRGRGLGTYGMKVLAERYLGGVVSFESADGAGTTFRLALPLEGKR